MRNLTAIGILALGTCAFAQDFTIGYSKVSGMAGAGLALRHEGTGGYPVNPAGLAYMQQFRLTNLDLGYVLDGISFGDLNDFLGTASHGGLNPKDLSELARNFGSHNVSYGLNGRLGLGANGVNVGVTGDALVRTTPNPQLQQWVNAGSDPNNPVAGMRLDGHGFGYHSVHFGYGRPIPTKDGSEMAVGAQVSFVRSYYTHHFVTQNQIINGGSTRAVEMGNDDVMSKNGVGLDLGWYMQVGQDKRFEFAAVMANALKPDIGFDGTESNSLTPTRIDPFERSLNLGVGFTAERGQIIAADVINIGNRNTDVRLGFDYPFSKQFGARAGYSGRGGFTAGVTLIGVSITFGSTNQFQAGTFFRF